MNKKIVIFLLLTILVILPIAVFAALPGPVSSVEAIVDNISGFIWKLFFGLAIIMFLVAAFQFLFANGEPGKITLAKQSLIWGVVGMVVGILAFSIPVLIQNTIAPPIAPPG